MLRTEFPEPQFERDDWVNLNGRWEFSADLAISGFDRHFEELDHLDGTIEVPFCPESTLSGVHNTDFMPCVWYRRTFSVRERHGGERLVLHFGAVDYAATVYVNGKVAGTHRGGYTPFSLDITDLVYTGENVLTVAALDDTRSGKQPCGKQSDRYASYACDYTRTTGIWQTVWMEYVPATHVSSVRYYPDPDNGSVHIVAETVGEGTLTAIIGYDGRDVGVNFKNSRGGRVDLEVELSEIHPWEPGNGRLYTVELLYGDDVVHSYFGLRTVRMEDGKLLINGTPVYMRTVLDQGFYPDGIYTAPTDEALERDIRLSMDMGFNGARLHQKVFEPRFLYHCDRLGYLVWGEMGNWGLDVSRPEALHAFLPEWEEAVTRDINHPAIIGWCPFNETWDYNGHPQYNDTLRVVYETTKRLDPTRPCIDTSGNFHVVTDIFDIHDYEQDPAVFGPRYAALAERGELFDVHKARQTYRGEPVFMSEYGGIYWNEEDQGGWGYGVAPKTPEHFMERYKGLTDALLDNPKLCGFCYTQLYDIEQERNGLYTYDRRPKFDPDFFKAVNSRTAAIEK